MQIEIEWEFDLDKEHPDYKDIHDKFAHEQGVPLVVDLYDYFQEPCAPSDDQVTDALSDEHGWLVQNWEIIEGSGAESKTVTVKDLIAILSKYHPANEVVIEVNHDEVLPINPKRIELGMITDEYLHASEEDRFAEAAVVIRL